MYINPFVAGIIVTLLAEFIGFIVLAIVKGNQEDKK